MKMEITTYKDEDYEALIRLFIHNSPKYFAAEELQDFKKYLKQEKEDYYIVKMEGAIVGCGGINYDYAEKTGIINWDMIAPSFHGKGIGSKLLNYRIGALQKNLEIEKIIVRTSQHTSPFYEKNGFQTVHVKKDFWAEGYDLYLMHYKSDN